MVSPECASIDISACADVKVTLTGQLSTLAPRPLHSARSRFHQRTWRSGCSYPAPPGSEEMMISPEKPPFKIAGLRLWNWSSYKGFEGWRLERIGTSPTCVTKIGIDVGVDGLNGTPLVVNVSV